MFSLESLHRGDSNEYTQYTIFDINTKNRSKLSQSCSLRFFSKGLKDDFEIAVVNESPVFEPLKFYFIPIFTNLILVDQMDALVKFSGINSYRNQNMLKPASCKQASVTYDGLVLMYMYSNLEKRD